MSHELPKEPPTPSERILVEKWLRTRVDNDLEGIPFRDAVKYLGYSASLSEADARRIVGRNRMIMAAWDIGYTEPEMTGAYMQCKTARSIAREWLARPEPAAVVAMATVPEPEPVVATATVPLPAAVALVLEDEIRRVCGLVCVDESTECAAQVAQLRKDNEMFVRNSGVTEDVCAQRNRERYENLYPIRDPGVAVPVFYAVTYTRIGGVPTPIIVPRTANIGDVASQIAHTTEDGMLACTHTHAISFGPLDPRNPTQRRIVPVLLTSL